MSFQLLPYLTHLTHKQYSRLLLEYEFCQSSKKQAISQIAHETFMRSTKTTPYGSLLCIVSSPKQ